MNKIRLIIFDFDGTIADTSGVILSTLKASFRDLGLPSQTDTRYRGVIGLPLDRCYSALVPMSAERAEECAATYRRLYPRFDTPDAVTLFPGVARTLERLSRQGVILTIATSRRHVSVDRYVRQLGLERVISLIVGADDVKETKPAPEAAEKIINACNIPPGECLVVGDAPYDILMGIAAGCRTCAVTCGNGTREELIRAKPDYLVDDVAHLLADDCKGCF